MTMELARNSSYIDQHDIGKAKHTETLVLNAEEDAERLQEELEAQNDPGKIADVLGIEIVQRIRFGDIKPEQTVPDGMQEELDYAENKWYCDGERVLHLVNKPTGDGHATYLEADAEYVRDWLGDRVLLRVWNTTHYNGLNADTHSVKTEIVTSDGGTV